MTRGASNRWIKHQGNPVLGGEYGTCFDLSILRLGGRYRMYFSWRPRKAIAVTESADGFSWSKPTIVLQGSGGDSWDSDVNRPSVILREGRYEMWYTGQDTSGAERGSRIGHATSPDGLTWKPREQPVLEASAPWEGGNLMCPHVLYDDAESIYKMWYSAGERYEPDAIGYATSADGLAWKRWAANPVFVTDSTHPWEAYKVTAGQVIKTKNGYLIFYIGFEDIDTARIGIARSPDGIHGWRRSGANPIISPDPGAWDSEACYKPFALRAEHGWMLWYNGRSGHLEQIGAATLDGDDLGFDD
jgi:predicted GH43/DUF377 family glycosyl hydrolase